MAGHSHWARIKRAKAVVDARRGKAWSKLARGIIVAARSGGGDPEMNLALRYAIDAARAANMPKDTIERAVRKGTGELGGESYEQVVYEGYAPGGVAVMCAVLTDNRNRTAPGIKRIFETAGGNLGASNCVAWLFTPRGVIVIPAQGVDEETLTQIALEAGAEDLKPIDGAYELVCDPSAFEGLRDALQKASLRVESAEVTMLPTTTVSVEGEQAERTLRLIEALEEHDDVQNVYSNFEIADAQMHKLAR